jgi:hypothetical protein
MLWRPDARWWPDNRHGAGSIYVSQDIPEDGHLGAGRQVQGRPGTGRSSRANAHGRHLASHAAESAIAVDERCARPARWPPHSRLTVSTRRRCPHSGRSWWQSRRSRRSRAVRIGFVPGDNSMGSNWAYLEHPTVQRPAPGSAGCTRLHLRSAPLDQSVSRCWTGSLSALLSAGLRRRRMLSCGREPITWNVTTLLPGRCTSLRTWRAPGDHPGRRAAFVRHAWTPPSRTSGRPTM